MLSWRIWILVTTATATASTTKQLVISKIWFRQISNAIPIYERDCCATKRHLVVKLFNALYAATCDPCSLDWSSAHKPEQQQQLKNHQQHHNSVPEGAKI